MHSLELFSFVFGVLSVLAFGIIAAFIGHQRYYKQQSSTRLTNVDFVTARKSLGYITIAWGIYSNAVGAGTAFFPPSFAAQPGVGLLGMFANAMANVIPPLFIYFFGNRIREMFPAALSLSHFMYLRYGRVVQLIVAVLVAFNMAMALIVEYTAITSIYRDLVGTEYAYIILFVIGITTTAYTAYGGLYASLATDQWQGCLGAILIAIMTIYTAVSSKVDLSRPFPRDLLVPDTKGYSALFVMPVSILTGTLLSEASFQRAWAAYDAKTLKKGAILGSVLIFVAVLLFSFGGILAVWDGREVSNENNILFALVGPPYAPTALTVIVVVVTTIMNTSAVDSIQNGLVSVITSNFFESIENVWYSRISVLVLNSICLAIGYLGPNKIITLFAITNIVTTMASVFFAGILDAKGRFVSGAGALFGFTFAAVNVVAYGWALKGNLFKGLAFVFLEDVYNYPVFVLALTSWIGLAIYEGVAYCISPGIFEARQSSSNPSAPSEYPSSSSK